MNKILKRNTEKKAYENLYNFIRLPKLLLLLFSVLMYDFLHPLHIPGWSDGVSFQLDSLLSVELMPSYFSGTTSKS